MRQSLKHDAAMLAFFFALNTPAYGAAPPGKTAAKPSPPAQAQKKAAPASSTASGPLKENFIDTGTYMVTMQKRISGNYHPPKVIKKVVIKWQVLPNGSISGLRVDKSSGDPANDKAALDSVSLSAPFDPLPCGVPAMPIQYTFEDVIRSGMEQISYSDRNDSINLSNAAIDCANRKEFAQAIDKLDFAFEKDPKNPAIAGVLRQISAYVNDETPDKVQILYRVLALDPQQYGAIEKLRVLHRAAGIDPDSANQTMALGDSLMKQWNAEGALVEFTAANSIAKGSCPPQKIAQAYRVLAGQRMARKWQMIFKVRKDVECLCGLGRAYQICGDYDKAMDYYKQALALDASSEMAKTLQAKVEEEKKTGISEKIDTIVVEHTTGEAGKSDLIPKAQILNNEGIDALNAGKFAEAIETFKKALTADPRNENAKTNLSAAFNNTGTKQQSPEEAVKYYRKALFMQPANKSALTNLASYLKYKGKNPDAFEDRIKLSQEFASAGDYVSAVVEVRVALARKKDAAAQSKLKEYLDKAPVVP